MIINSFIAKDGKEVFYRQWLQVDNPKGVIHINHGMLEHMGRYDDFAKYLNLNGYIVYGIDFRGHGYTARKNNSYGYFDESFDIDGWNLVLNDINQLLDEQKLIYKDLPFFMLGHSMGSFITREYIQNHSYKLDGSIIMATGEIENKLQLILLKFITSILPQKSPASLIHLQTFGKFNKNIDNPETDFDWLTHNKYELQKYLDDPEVGFMPTNSFYNDFSKGLLRLNKTESEMDIDKNFPILITAGLEDPLNENGKAIFNLEKKYKSAGLEKIDVKLYDNYLHEILHEKNKEQVFHDLLDWLDKII